jgi:alkaline phosphatase
MCGAALNIVSGGENSYFVMIECARIDWEAHDNDLTAIYRAVEDMNNVLKIAYSYYQKDPQNTLLVFTSDHETGGPEIAYRKVDKNQMESKRLKNGQLWTNNTNPLMYDQYVLNLEKQRSTVSKVLGKAKSPGELKASVKKELGYTLTDEDVDLLFYAKSNYMKYKD